VRTAKKRLLTRECKDFFHSAKIQPISPEGNGRKKHKIRKAKQFEAIFAARLQPIE